MSTKRIIVSGFGGQGVMGIGQLLTYAGLYDQKEVSWLPSYGPEMRGGAANCSVIISDEKIGAPTISTATDAIVMNEPSLVKFESYVKPGGTLFINSSLITKKATRDDIKVIYIPVNDLAIEFGNTKTLNMIMVGAFNGIVGAVSEEAVKYAVEQLYGKKKPEMLEKNIEALKFGAKRVKEIANA